MNKIKDFFYDKNDIIVVLIILAVAGFIIYTRIGSIMEYPEVLAEQAAATETREAEEESQESRSDASSSSASQSITVTDSDTSSSVAEKLYDAGLISSASDFEEYISNEGLSDSIQSGTFQIPSGSSEEEILDIIAE